MSKYTNSKGYFSARGFATLEDQIMDSLLGYDVGSPFAKLMENMPKIKLPDTFSISPFQNDAEEDLEKVAVKEAEENL